MRKLSGRRGQLRHAAVQGLQNDAAGHCHFTDDAAEGMDLDERSPNQRPGGVDPIAADASRVDDGDVGAGCGPHCIGDHVAEVGFAGAHVQRVGVEGHAARAHDDGQLGTEPRFVRRHDAGGARLVRERCGDGNELEEPLDGPTGAMVHVNHIVQAAALLVPELILK